LSGICGKKAVERLDQMADGDVAALQVTQDLRGIPTKDHVIAIEQVRLN